jgi:three-Cys-motif partner protein
MVSNSNFFSSPQAAAIYKHQLIKRYIPAWAGKVGSTSTGKKVLVYDAYSGPGRYEDEAPGSPEVLVDTAVAMANLRSVYSVFSEKEQAYLNKLRAMLTEKGVDPDTYDVKQGPVERHIDDVVALAEDLPLFVFLDPYGFTLPFDRMVNLLKCRDKAGYYSNVLQPKTEVLINFSFEAVRRTAGALTSGKDYPAREGHIQSLTSFLGGDWWKPMLLRGDDDWVQQVLQRYADEVSNATGYAYITASVADSLTAEPVYELILFTRHPDGLWKMMDAMSQARKHWRNWLVEQREVATAGQAELRGLDWDDDEDAWVEEIATNIEGILATHPAFVVENELGEVLGRTLGLARETHIRKALRRVKEHEVIAAVPTGNLQKAYITRK